jgi:hypothetical protein
VAFSPDGKILAATNTDKKVFEWEIETFKVREKAP